MRVRRCVDRLARQVVLLDRLFQPFFDLSQRGLARAQLRPDFVFVFLFADAAQPEPAHHVGQHQALADQRNDDDAEGDEQDQVAVRERLRR